jgi:SM-20-related protein
VNRVKNEISKKISDLGYCVIPAFLTPTLTAALAVDLDHLYDKNKFRDAAVGQGTDRKKMDVVRRDQICWLDSAFPNEVQNSLLGKMEGLRQELNEQLLLGLFNFEMLYSVYHPGAFYKRHRDVFQNDDSRMISTVLYLNENWEPNDGGELVIYGANDVPIDVRPVGGTLVCFLSSLDHEVRATFKLRKSCAGWFSKRKMRKKKGRISSPLPNFLFQ